MSGDASCVPRCTFHQKACGGPAGEIVQPYETAHVPAGLFIVPGTEILFPEQASGHIFGSKDECGINTAAHCPVQAAEQTEKRRKKTACSVDGKHPQRGGAFQGELSPAQGLEGGEKDFKTPAKDAAFKKIGK